MGLRLAGDDQVRLFWQSCATRDNTLAVWLPGMKPVHGAVPAASAQILADSGCT
jgi:hypothetical protein